MPHPIFSFRIPRVVGDPNDWLPDFPNPADLVFDYYRLLSLAQQNDNSIGFWPPNDAPEVAIVGAGCAGMVAARELFRCGCKVTIYEASNRICGRHFTLDVPGQTTGMELGAMRFPYFTEPGSQNSVFDYYLTSEASAQTALFPNPGSAAANTGVYVNEGYGPNDEFYPEKKMILWPASPNDYNPPDDPYLKAVYDKVSKFLALFTGGVAKNYATPGWTADWQQIANHYEQMSFSDLVFTEAMRPDQYQNDGWFGGFGMNAAESQLFYTIGSGDGSWGAFYEIGAMWFIRTVMFGFESNLQTVIGLNDSAGLPFYDDQSLRDTNGAPLEGPLYSGIQSLVQWLFFVPAPGAGRSLFDAANDGVDAALYLSTPVTAIAKTAQGLQVTDGNGVTRLFDYAILTPEIWATELSIETQGFDVQNDLPPSVVIARNEQHVIASAKVFFPLTKTYWESSPIPQLIMTDTFVQDAYGMKWSNDDPGVLLASYTWEDDALKLLATSDAELARQVLAELDVITASTLNDTISSYVDANDATVFMWSTQPTYRGCAKLYRQRNWSLNYALLAYNQQNSAFSRLYFAGESWGVEGGWTEPALRMAIDAVIHLIQSSGGSFNNGFTFNDYPRYDTAFEPNLVYPVGNDA